MPKKLKILNENKWMFKWDEAKEGEWEIEHVTKWSCVEAQDHPRVSIVESMNEVEWKYWGFLGI
jgi:hypothetical protein